MELGDPQLALEKGSRLDTAGLPTERRTRHALDIAKAFSLRNQQDEALAKLLEAERTAPEQVHAHFLARQVIHTLILGSRRRPSRDLLGLVTRMRALD